MSSILYYSNYCDNCKTLLQNISKIDEIKKNMHFINVDKRVKKPNGDIFIVLENSQELILPPTVKKVPSLLLLNKNHQVISGIVDITKYLEPVAQTQNVRATNNNGEPVAYSIGSSNFITSDNFSFLDQDADSLLAKNDGGMRQQHHYATINYSGAIDTPPDSYAPDKIGSVSIEQLQTKRNSEIGSKR